HGCGPSRDSPAQHGRYTASPDKHGEKLDPSTQCTAGKKPSELGRAVDSSHAAACHPAEYPQAPAFEFAGAEAGSAACTDRGQCGRSPTWCGTSGFVSEIRPVGERWVRCAVGRRISESGRKCVCAWVGSHGTDIQCWSHKSSYHCGGCAARSRRGQL